jgi:hypothetical protein
MFQYLETNANNFDVGLIPFSETRFLSNTLTVLLNGLANLLLGLCIRKESFVVERA